MVRLILEENGKRRAFRVGDGVLKLGSGAEASLRLESDGIAAEHAELEVEGDHARLRVAPGVVPPEIDGEAVLGEATLHMGQALRLGAALVWLEDEAAEPGSGRPGGSASVAAGPAAGVSTAKREASRQRAMAAARSRPSRSTVQRSRPRVERGLPSGAIVGIVLGVLVVAGLLMRKAFQVSAENTTDARALLIGVKEKIDEALYDQAEAKLALIQPDQLSDAQREQVARYRQEIADGYALQDKADFYREGNKYFDVYLAKYEDRYLQGDPAKSRIRLFLKRAREFRQKWPEHEELDWVTRQEQRFRGAGVNLSEPPSFADIDWEIEFILGGTPRKYELALDMIDEYLARTGTPELDREAAQALRAEIEAERPEQFSEAMKWAKHEHENGDDQKAVQWLVYSAAYMADPALEDEAARYLLQMPDLKAHLEAYQREKPDIFEALIENRLVRAKAAELGVL